MKKSLTPSQALHNLKNEVIKLFTGSYTPTPRQFCVALMKFYAVGGFIIAVGYFLFSL